MAWEVLPKGDNGFFCLEIDDPDGSIGMRGNSQFTFWAVILHSTGSWEIPGHKGTQRYILGMLSTHWVFLDVAHQEAHLDDQFTNAVIHNCVCYPSSK